MTKNPFLTYGYNGPEYFCDREEETKRLTTLLRNGNHVALMSPRRMGKTGLIRHCFAQQELQKDYYLFIVDIYATKSLAELSYELGKAILSVLKSKERKACERFIHTWCVWTSKLESGNRRHTGSKDISWWDFPVFGFCRQALYSSHWWVPDHHRLSGSERRGTSSHLHSKVQ